MEVLPCSGVQYAAESDGPQQSPVTSFVYDGEPNRSENGERVELESGQLNDSLLKLKGPQVEGQGEVQEAVGKLSDSPDWKCSGASNCECQALDQKESSRFHTFDEDEIDEPCLISENPVPFVDTIESDSPNNSRDGEFPLAEPSWLEGDESVALWVKWRGKWQAGIRCARVDWPLSTLKAKPTHGRKKYFVIFFPHTRNYSWADMMLVCSINEFPQPIAYKTHQAGLKMVRDLSVARRFIMHKLVIGMLNIIDQIHLDALIEAARDVMFWKEFALEASRSNGYSDLGRMLQKLQNELFDSILWNDISTLWDAPVQPILGSEWKTWKHEVMKWFFSSPSLSSSKDMQQLQTSDGPSQASLQVCRKRPKLEVRRAEMHASQVETKGSDHSIALETDSGFFNDQDTVNTLAAETCKLEELRGAPIPIDSPGNLTNKWNGIVVESAADSELLHTKAMESTPSNEMVGPKSVEPGGKNRQCVAYIEAKGRQCVRWANDGDVYCCVHLSSRFLGSSARAERSASVDAPICEGTTVLGTRCKHRALPGSSFCKKHRPHAETDHTPNSPQASLKRKREENYPSSGSMLCKDIVLADAESPLQVDPVSAMDDDTFHGNSNLNGKPMHFGNDHNTMEELHCIGSSPFDDKNSCLETPKRYFLYCEKHLPSWLKRARNGKSRIISKEVFAELLRDCLSQEQKVKLHKACELFYRLFKSILSLRNPVPKEVQFQWALTEASKDTSVREFFKKVVHSEKERIKMIWGFNDEKDIPSLMEKIPQLPFTVNDSFGNENVVACKICSAEFPDLQALGSHWMENHKKESQWLFRGYACAICLDSFTNKKVLENHVQERHHVQFVEQCMLLQCIPCSSHFGNTEQLWLHVLSVHPIDFKASKAPEQQTLSTGEGSSMQLEAEQANLASLETNLENSGGSRKFICRFCGLKFDLLPDLGRHHQAAHMGPNLVSSRPSKKGVRYYPYRLKSGRLSRPRLKKSLVSASYRIRSRASANLKRRIQATKSLGIGGITVQPQVTETRNIGKLAEYQCSAVAKILFSEIQKTKPRPNNHDILSISRSACCKFGLQAALEEKFGTLPEKLYLKAARLCSEHNILVSWHHEGFNCPRGCKVLKDQPLFSHLASLPNGFVKQKALNLSDPAVDQWEVDEFHYTINSHHLKPESLQKAVVLCDDISFGKESVPVFCVVDQELLNSLHMSGSNEHDMNLSMPWESFTYITKPMLDQSMNLDSESLQLGCSCSYSTCSPETCSHVYLFDNDYEDSRDIFGKSMRGRFPYDENGRMVLEEGYLVYECNSRCRCSNTCPNRILQNGVRVKLEVFKTEKKGWAVRAGEAILRGTFVCEFVGEVLNEQEAHNRRKRYGIEGCSYFLDIDAHINDMSRLIERQGRYVIDASRYGNVSRFINHSCSPNLVNYQVLVESMDCERTHIGLYASRDIALGEELTYDYHYELLPGEGSPCHCGSLKCRGRLH